MVLTLLTFPGSDHLPTHSPFGMKAMCLLQMSGVSWKPEYITDLTAMPLGRVPVLRADDRLIPDSHNIQAYLEDHGAKLNDGLSATERAISHALVRMIEDGMRLGLVHDRWLHPDVWPVMRDQFFAQVPEQARETVGEEVRGHVRAGLMSQGIAQFDEADRLLIGRVFGLQRLDHPFLRGAGAAPIGLEIQKHGLARGQFGFDQAGGVIHPGQRGRWQQRGGCDQKVTTVHGASSLNQMETERSISHAGRFCTAQTSTM